MSGWMVLTGTSQGPEVVRAVVPVIALPLTAVAFGANALATLVAGWFGLKLHWEGPKRLLEVLLKPKVLISALILNLALWGAYKGYGYWSTLPASLWRVEYINHKLAREVSASFGHRTYEDVTERANLGVATATAPAKELELKQVWGRKLKKAVFGGVTLSGHSAFVGSDDGYVYELDRGNGSILRKFFIGTEVTPDPVIWKDRLVAGEGIHDSHHSRVYFFDLTTGLFQGAFRTRGHTEGQPVFAESSGVTTLFVMAGGDGVYAIDPETRQARWHLLSGHVDSEVRVAGGLVFYSTGVEKGYPDRTHLAIAADFRDGHIVWQRELPASGWMAPVLVDSRVCFGTGEIYSASKAGWLTCLDQKSGEPLQSASLDAPVASIPYLSASRILVADLEGTVCSLDSRTLSRGWCVKTLGKKTYASVVDDSRGRLLYPTTENGLWVLDPSTGKTLAKWLPQGSEGKWGKIYSRVAVGADGWFVSDMEGNIRKLQPTERETK